MTPLRASCCHIASFLCLASSASAQHLEYDAGIAGDPPQAPSPTSVGWLEYLSGAATRTDVSPDTDWNINAWQVVDPGAGQVGYRLGSLPEAFVFTMEMRPLAQSTWVVFDTGDLIVDNWFEIEFEIQGNDVVVDSHHMGGSNPLLCPGGTDGAYHTYALVSYFHFDNCLDLYYDHVLVGEVEYTTSGMIKPGEEISWGTRDGAGRARYHFVDFRAIDHDGPIGQSYCGPAVPNSTGAPALIEASGLVREVSNDLTLTASDMPTNQFGYFLASQTQDFVAQPGGSQGNLCLGGNIGRFVSQIQNSGNAGSFSIPVNLTQIPTNPPHDVQIGETWNFQAWYRDMNPGTTSNFTDAVSITFF